MNLKWQLALLSMRTIKFFQKTDRKVTINGSDTAGYDKSKGECFNCHKLRHFAKECRQPRNQDSRNRNQDSSRRTVDVEETASNAMVAIDGAGFNWIYMENDEVPTTMALMAFSDSKANYNYHQRERVVSWNNYTRVNYNYHTKKAHPSAHRNMAPRAVLMKTGLRPLNTARPVNTAHPKTTVYSARPMSSFSKSAQSTGTYPISLTLKNLMKDMLPLREEPKEGKLLMCDKKKSILFTDTRCFVLSPDFKLADESLVLLKVPRKNNMYIVDMKNIVLKKSLTCLVAKATLDESMLWHRRLGHVNFKNKLVKENLVRGLPTKRFINNQTCVACLKGKQHKASCKSKIQNSITQPLFMLHMDLFDLIFVSSLMNKKYCPVVTDNYSRFTWVFWLATKDETSGILKSFITKIENLVDKKAKIIRCDNGTEFKNRVMSEFCEKKCIKKEFSVARTPQQNGVAERINKTLIEAVRTMLADSKLPTTFWAEEVNSACYVQNRVLVVKPHNKTLYELYRGKTHTLSFMRPFGCHVTILNTLDHLGKFDGKSNDGFFVRNSLYSKAFRVYNIRTRKVEENLSIRFLENKPILQDDKGVSKESGIDDQQRPSINTASLNVNTNRASINTASPNVNTDRPSINTTSNAEVDLSNIFTTYLVPSTPNTQIHKDHSLDHVIGDVQSGVQTKRMTKTTSEQGFISVVYEWKTHKDLHTCLFACFLSHEEPKKMDLKSTFLYGKIKEEVYVCQPLGFEDPEFPNKVYKVEKALYGLHQAPRAWKEMCTEFEKMMHEKFQMSSMGKLTFFLGLQVTQKDNGIFISRDKYVDEILKKFGFSNVKTASTPIETSKPLLKDENAEDVNVHLYRSMIGSLMYLTSSRPDIMFVVCACATFQITPKVSHLHAVKRIFRYLKGQPKLGLWYPKDSPFELEAYTDSDYAGVSFDMKSTTKGYQFLGSRLILLQCKTQTIVSNSTTEARYVAASNCCGQVLWIQNQMLDYGYNFMNTKIFIDNESTICIVKNPVFNSKTKHIEIQHHFIRDSNEKKLIQMINIYTDQNVTDLLTKAFDVGRFQYLVATTNDEIQVSTVALTYYCDPHNMVAYLEKTEGSGGCHQIVDFLNASHIRISIRQETKVPQLSSPPHISVADEAASTGVDVRSGGAATTVTRVDARQASVQHDAKIQGRNGHDMEFDTVEPVDTASAAVTTASITFSTASPTKVSIADDITMATLVYIRKSAVKDKEAAMRLQAEIDEEERQRIARLAMRLQAKEKENYTEAEKARMLVEFINQIKRYFAVQRVEERRNKPPTQAQKRTYMSYYIKNIGAYTLQPLRGYSFDEIKTLFETTMRWVNTFVPMETEVKRGVLELVADSSQAAVREAEGTNRAVEEELGHQSSKKQNSDKEREIWEELKRLFELYADDELWKSQKHIHHGDMTWRLYDTCGVHHVSAKDEVDIYMLVEREYPLSRGVLTLMLVVKLMVDQHSEMANELLQKIFMHAEIPRR
uniref:Putative ribonuclease H-like domain-containing protein n=1 Tax=Tanacetum cinerariifolium TaxID=118510 RepID=A0A699H2S9_TANCI|nr:putative ribonuclease H-like domain-containing protein [Tanacetum cinerariifolium]